MRTDEKLNQLCDRLHYNCGDIHEAARFIGVSPAFVYSWIKDDKVAAEHIQEAQRVGYGGLESEAIRRAVIGDEKTVYYKGMPVGTEHVKSDGLLGKLMEARIPEYRKGENGPGNSFYGPTQINLMPRATTYDEWVMMRDSALRMREEELAQEALPAPERVIEGQFTEVERPLASLAGLL